MTTDSPCLLGWPDSAAPFYHHIMGATAAKDNACGVFGSEEQEGPTAIPMLTK